MTEVLNEKNGYLERIEELSSEIKATQMKMCDLNMENDKHNDDFSEKLRYKELYVEKLNEELKHQKSTIKSQETTISYFRKKVEELTKQLEEEKAQRVNLMSEVRRIEHMSSKASSPRGEEDRPVGEGLLSQEDQLLDNFDIEDLKSNTPRSRIKHLDEQIRGANQSARRKDKIRPKVHQKKGSQ